MSVPVVTVQGVKMSTAAAANVEEAGVSVTADVAAVSAGDLSPADLLAQCLDGCELDRVDGWRDYVYAVEAECIARDAFLPGQIEASRA